MIKLLYVIFAIFLAVISVLGVNSATYQEVSVTATPKFTDGITNFTVTYVNETQIDLSWGFSGDAVNIMIRAKYGEYPDDIPDEDTAPTDGYLVYYGSGTSCSDTSVNFDENVSTLFYKAWGQKASGKWYTDTSTGEQESEMLLLGILAGLALIPLIASFALKSGRKILCWVSAGGWILLSAYSYTRYETLWDVYYSLFLFAGIMVMACAFLPLIFKEKKEDDLSVDELEGFSKDEKMLYKELQAEDAERKKFDKLFPRRPRRKKAVRVRMPKEFAKKAR